MRSTQPLIKRIFSIGLLACLTAVGCLAQESRGSFTGRVIDPQSAVMVGVNVTVTNVGTNISNIAVTNASGYWEVNFLIPGDYSVTAEATGFKKVTRTGVSLSTGDRLAVDIQMQIGESTQSVVVTADAPLLNTTTAETARVLNSTDMAQLPYTNMNPFALQAMAAGMMLTGSLQPDNNRALD